MAATSAIFLAALITEGLLIVVSYVLYGLFDLALPWGINLPALVWAIVLTAPLLCFNHFLWMWNNKNLKSVYAKFSREVVTPLCKQVRPPMALLLALLSGFGEELFFRGVLEQIFSAYVGLATSAVITSFLFAYVHFIGQLRRFGKLLGLYSAVGMYLWVICWWSDSLFAAMVTHGLYNFIVMTYTGISARREAQGR